MRHIVSVLLMSGLILAAAPFEATTAQAQEAYRGKTLSVQIGYGAGGGYDTYGRLLARYMGKHIPGNPVLVPKNMPGAGSMKLANYLYVTAPKDGTEFGIIGNGVILEPLLGGAGAQFDPTKFSWLGSLDKFVEIGVVRSNARAQSLEDAMKTEMVVGSTGSKSGTNLYPILLNNILGTKFKIVKGYTGTKEMTLAVERGELDGFLGWCVSCILSEKPDWVREKTVKVFVQTALEKDPRFPDAAMVMDYIKNEEDRKIMTLFLSNAEMSRPFVAPPNIPRDRFAILRAAFEASARDPNMVADAKKMNLDINLMTGETIDKLIETIYNSPKSVVEKASAIFNQG
jgi:tripartite-type tricarboxylate transporter receptor subunit TctC